MKPNIQQQIAPEVEKTTVPELQWGGPVSFGGSAKQIAVGQNADGHLEVFYVGTNNDFYTIARRWYRAVSYGPSRLAFRMTVPCRLRCQQIL